jgi:hypothetical protein
LIKPCYQWNELLQQQQNNMVNKKSITMKNKIKFMPILIGIAMAINATAQNVNTSGTQTTGYITKWTAGNPTYSIGNSVLQESSSNIGIGLSPNGAVKLDVNGHVNITSSSAYKIGTNNILWHNNNTNDIFVGYQAGNANMSQHYNTLIGSNAGYSLTKGGRNTFVGYAAGTSATTADSNVAVGYQAFNSNLTCMYNTAVGYQALALGSSCPLCWDGRSSTNTAIGFQSLMNSQAYGGCTLGFQTGLKNHNGCSLVAVGEQACRENYDGDDNEGFGESALVYNTNASDNVALGNMALQNQSYTNGGTKWSTNNVAVGNHALYTNNPTSSSNGMNNTAVGHDAAYKNSTGNNNVISGYQAGYYNETGSNNSLYGFKAGYGNGSVNSHSGNSFFGSQAGYGITTGGSNVLIGYQCGYSVAAGTNNSGIGYQALYNNTSSDNSAFGFQALVNNSTSGYNSAFGYTALASNTTSAGYNNAFGFQSLNANNTGSYNNAFGGNSLSGNTTGTNNSAMGWDALLSNTTHSDNTAVGHAAIYQTDANYNTGVGYEAGEKNTTGTNNTYLGELADANGTGYNNSAAIGSNATTTGTNIMYLGNANALIYCAQGLWTGSDGRFKTNVKEEVKGLTFIKKLRPVTYNLDTKAFDDFLIQNLADSIKTQHRAGMDFTSSVSVLHSGFIAQEVAQAAKDVGFASDIVHNPENSNDHYGLNYAEFVVPLVKAVQELSKTTDSVTTKSTKQDSVIASQNKKIDDLQAQITACCNKPGGMKIVDNNVNPTGGSSTSKTNVGGVSGNIQSNNTAAALFQNIPNPFNQQTNIGYTIPTTAQSASMMIFDLQGKLIKNIPVTNFGNGSVTINGNELAAGMFVYTLVVDGNIIDTKRMILTE